MFLKKNIQNNRPSLINRKSLEKVWVFTNARDEPNIAEWVAHYLVLGFDHIVIFDHLSINPIEKQLKDKFKNKVSVINVTGNGNIKVDLMYKAVEIANNQSVNWFLYVDADEFLVLNSHNQIKEYLSLFNEADAIAINWLFFGSNGYEEQPKGLLTNNFLRSDIRLNTHVKTIVRPHFVKKIENPHYYILQNPNRFFTGNGRPMKTGPFNDEPLPFFKSMVYIAHYYGQSHNEWKRRKGRILDDGSTIKGLDINFHNKHNEVGNTQLQNKYSEKIKNLLERNNIVL
jgi:hypothetical protein